MGALPHSTLDLARGVLAEAGGGLLTATALNPFLAGLYGRLGSSLGLECFLHYEPSDVEGQIKLRMHGGIPDDMRGVLREAVVADLLCAEVYATGSPIVMDARDLAEERRL